MDFLTLAAQRYSCRNFSSRPVPDELMDKIIEAGLLAPTAVNRQPYMLFSMDSPEARDRIRQVTDFTFGASRFLVVGADPAAAWVRKFDGHNFGQVDAAIAAAHIMMEIADLGLGTTWVGHFDAPKLKEFYPQMKDLDLIAIFPIGYPAEDAAPSPRHTERRTKAQALQVL